MIECFQTEGKVMPFYNERRLFKKNPGVIHKPLHIILMSGVLLLAFAAHFFDAELAAQYGSEDEQAMSKLAFAPQGFEAYLTDKAVKDRQIILTRVSVEAPLTRPPSNATSENLLIVTPKEDMRSGDDARVRVRVISHVLSGYSKAPTDIFSDGVSMPESKRLPRVVKAFSVQGGEPYSATSLWLTNEPSETASTTMVKVDEDVGKARLQPKVAKPRQVSVRSRRPRARAKRPSSSAGQPLYQDLPKWARTALFNAGN